MLQRVVQEGTSVRPRCKKTMILWHRLSPPPGADAIRAVSPSNTPGWKLSGLNRARSDLCAGRVSTAII